MSFLSVNSWKADSITLVWVSAASASDMLAAQADVVDESRQRNGTLTCVNDKEILGLVVVDVSDTSEQHAGDGVLGLV